MERGGLHGVRTEQGWRPVEIFQYCIATNQVSAQRSHIGGDAGVAHCCAHCLKVGGQRCLIRALSGEGEVRALSQLRDKTLVDEATHD